MARVRTGLGDLDQLPGSYTRAHGFDDSWKTQAKCRGVNLNSRSPYCRAWTIFPWEKHKLPDGSVVLGAVLIEAALLYCGGCPVQWSCARWAIDIQEPVGTWAMHREDLEWLWGLGEVATKIINRAEDRGESVQVAVRKARTAYDRRAVR